jgi:hypothetical protein
MLGNGTGRLLPPLSDVVFSRDVMLSPGNCKWTTGALLLLWLDVVWIVNSAQHQAREVGCTPVVVSGCSMKMQRYEQSTVMIDSSNKSFWFFLACTRNPKGWTPLSYCRAKGKYGATEEKGIYPEVGDLFCLLIRLIRVVISQHHLLVINVLRGEQHQI